MFASQLFPRLKCLMFCQDLALSLSLLTVDDCSVSHQLSKRYCVKTSPLAYKNHQIPHVPRDFGDTDHWSLCSDPVVKWKEIKEELKVEKLLCHPRRWMNFEAVVRGPRFNLSSMYKTAECVCAFLHKSILFDVHSFSRKKTTKHCRRNAVMSASHTTFKM